MPRSKREMIRWPAIITLAVTGLRLIGELMGGPQLLFGSEGGGGGSLVGIVWLVPIFGIYFALQLARDGKRPDSAGKAIGWAVLALVVTMAVIALTFSPTPTLTGYLGMGVASIAGALIARRAWPTLFTLQFNYALAARIPVAIIMFFAIMGKWGTHYDALPPDFPEMGLLAKWFLLGLVPQLFFWVAFTVIVGAIFGIIAVALVRR